MFSNRCKRPKQLSMWVSCAELPVGAADPFYLALEATLVSIGFADRVREICAPSYADARLGGRPGIDPAVYFKMLMVGFFEDLPSERAIAWRCGEGMSVRKFLGYSLTEATPDHSSLSVIEANAALRSLRHRDSKKQYWEYVRDLDAEVGQTKDSATDMVYHPEHVIDLDNGAAVSVEVHMGDSRDTQDLSQRLSLVQVMLQQLSGDKSAVVDETPMKKTVGTEVAVAQNVAEEIVATLSYNLILLLRVKRGCETLKQWLASSKKLRQALATLKIALRNRRSTQIRRLTFLKTAHAAQLNPFWLFRPRALPFG